MSNEDSMLLVSLVQDVVRERNVHEDDVYFAIENALLDLARARYGNADLTLKIDRATGRMTLLQNCQIVDSEADCMQMSLNHALLIDPQAQLGGKVGKVLDFHGFDRVAAHTAKNLLYKNLEQLRRARELAEFTPRIGEIVNCIVKQTSYTGDLVVTIGKGIGSVRRADLLPNEVGKYGPGDEIKAYIKNVTDKTEQQIHLSRTHNDFLVKLLTAQVTELQDHKIEIKKVVREPGVRAKVAVLSNDHSIDPVRVCVGQSGKIIQSVISELKGERIDIIPFDSNVVKFAINSLKPGEAVRAIYRTSNIILVVADDQKKKAIGEFGVNVKLASALTDISISVLTLTEFAERQLELETFLEITLDVDHDIAALLVAKGFETIHDINTTSMEELASVTGMDPELIQEVADRISLHTEKSGQWIKEHAYKNHNFGDGQAKNHTYTDSKITNNDIVKDIKNAYVDPRIFKIAGLKTPYIQILVEHDINTIEKLAMQTPEAVKGMLSGFKVAQLSVVRIIAQAAKMANLVKKFNNSYKPADKYKNTANKLK